MITIKSQGASEDAGELLNFYIQRGNRRINLDPVDGPFVFFTRCELLDNTVITAHEKLPTIAGAGAVRAIQAGIKPHCMAVGVRLFYTNGSNCRISNLVCDFNMENGYRQASTLITHGNFEGPYNRLDNNVYEDLTFIDSYQGARFRDPAQPGQETDSWSVVFTHSHESGLTNTTLRNCFHFTPGVSFTAGAAGPGVNGLLIENNFCQFGNPEGISLASRYGVNLVQDTPDDTATLQNITIRNNKIWDFGAFGIVVGQDNILGNENLHEVNLRNIFIHNNWITVNSFREGNFPLCCQIKTGEAAGSVMENVNVFNNIFDVRRVHPTATPYWLTGRGPIDGTGLTEIRHYGNTNLGSGANAFQQIDNVYTEAL